MLNEELITFVESLLAFAGEIARAVEIRPTFYQEICLRQNFLEMMLLALEAGEISEVQASRLAGFNRVTLREMRLAAIGAVQSRWRHLKEKKGGEA